MLTDGTGKAPEHVLSKAVLKNKDQDVREIFASPPATPAHGRWSVKAGFVPCADVVDLGFCTVFFIASGVTWNEREAQSAYMYGASLPTCWRYKVHLLFTGAFLNRLTRRKHA